MTERLTMNPETAVNIAYETGKAAPAVAVSGAMLYGIPINDVIQWLTLCYVFGLCIAGAWRFYRWCRRRAWREA